MKDCKYSIQYVPNMGQLNIQINVSYYIYIVYLLPIMKNISFYVYVVSSCPTEAISCMSITAVFFFFNSFIVVETLH